MTTPRVTSSATMWLTVTGLAVGAGALGVGVTDSVASATSSPSTYCPAGSSLVASGICQVSFTSSTTWTAPQGVNSLQILTVGAGGGGGGGTTYGPGGGGGGGAVHVCTTSLVDLTRHVAVTVGVGGAGGANGSGNLFDNSYGGKYGDAGTNGAATTVTDSKTLCSAFGGSGGAPGYNYYGESLPSTAFYGGGGNSGSGNLGGSAVGLVVDNAASPYCTRTDFRYNLLASGGAGDAETGWTPLDSTSGYGGDGSSPTTGLFSNNTTIYGGGGGGGSGSDCHGSDKPGLGGDGGGGNGGYGGAQPAPAIAHDAILTSTLPTSGTPNTGSGGGGGAGQYPGVGQVAALGTPGASGANGVVIIRFHALSKVATTSAVYFAVNSSALNSASKSTLSAFVTKAVAAGQTTVRVDGYTDPSGSLSLNAALSKARAANVANYVQSLFASHHLHSHVSSYGDGVKSTYANYALDRVATLSATATP